MIASPSHLTARLKARVAVTDFRHDSAVPAAQRRQQAASKHPLFQRLQKRRSGEGSRRGNSPEMQCLGSTADLWWHRVRMEHFRWHFSLLSFGKRALGLSLRFKTSTNGERSALNARPRKLAVFLNFSDDRSQKGPSATLQPLERSTAHSVYTRDPPPPLHSREALTAILSADWTGG